MSGNWAGNEQAERAREGWNRRSRMIANIQHLGHHWMHIQLMHHSPCKANHNQNQFQDVDNRSFFTREGGCIYDFGTITKWFLTQPLEIFGSSAS